MPDLVSTKASPRGKKETVIRSDQLRGAENMITNVFGEAEPRCPRLNAPFQASDCPNPIKLGYYGNAFGTCMKAVGCGKDRARYKKKLFRTKSHCERALRVKC